MVDVVFFSAKGSTTISAKYDTYSPKTLKLLEVATFSLQQTKKQFFWHLLDKLYLKLFGRRLCDQNSGYRFWWRRITCIENFFFRVVFGLETAQGVWNYRLKMNEREE